MKFNSKHVYVFSLLFVLAILISSASAAEKLVSNDFDNESFAMDVPSGSDFQKEATTNLKVDNISMNMLVFANYGKNADDVNSIMYLKDSSSNLNIIEDAVNDLKKEGVVVEETDKYFVVENKNNGNFLNWDIGSDLENFFSGIDGLFSSSDVNVSSSDADVQVSTADGINIVDNEDNTVSLSGEGFHVSDANGEDVSISSEGIKISSKSSSGNGSSNVIEEANVSVDGNMISDMGDGDYFLCMENPDNNQLIVLNGNNLELMKSMANTTSFSK